MKHFDTLDDILVFMKKKHKDVNTPRKGCYAIKMLRNAVGVRVPFEEMKGFRIHDFHVFDDAVVIDQIARSEFKKNDIHTVSSRLFLLDLIMINVYDHQTDFYSRDSIDFVYIENSIDSKAQMLVAWENPTPGPLRAQWVRNDPQIDRLLAEIGSHRVIREEVKLSRNIDMN